VRQNPNDPRILSVVIQIAAVFKSYTNALFAVDHMLKLNPTDVPTLLSKGVLHIQSGKPEEAVPALTQVLSLQSTNYGARLYRAVAYLSSKQYDEAQKDYELLQKTFPNSNEVNSGLGDIAWQRKDTNNAIKYYELCLKNVPVGSQQARIFADRINSLKSPTP
jgi:predicted Zn-dependent protease